MNALGAAVRRRHAEHEHELDEGTAIVEFVFVAILVMVPLIYLVVAVATVQRNELAVSDAAREAGRAFATSDTQDAAAGRAEVAVRLALADQGLPDDVELRFVAIGAACSSPAIDPMLRAGGRYTVCVTRRVDVPGVPSFLAGKGITTVGRYDLYIDDYRATPSGSS